jgi:hypothetical protein
VDFLDAILTAYGPQHDKFHVLGHFVLDGQICMVWVGYPVITKHDKTPGVDLLVKSLLYVLCGAY